MGWWVIDPDTGMPKKGSVSKAKPKDGGVFVNAFPGIDDAAESQYLGDEPMDWADGAAEELRASFGPDWAPAPEDIRRVLSGDNTGAGVDASVVAKVSQTVSEFWASVDQSYQDSWQRPPTADERRWCGELVVQQFGGG
jgi:hypothetical protein